jgi:hypothetical protein
MGGEGLRGPLRTRATGAISRIVQQNCPIDFSENDLRSAAFLLIERGRYTRMPEIVALP